MIKYGSWLLLRREYFVKIIFYKHFLLNILYYFLFYYKTMNKVNKHTLNQPLPS